MSTTKRVTGALAVLVTLAAVCAGVLVVSGGSQPAGASGIALAVAVDPADAAAEVGDLASAATPEQSEWLADGKVTSTEYERAVEQTVACIQERSEPLLEESGAKMSLHGPTFSPDRYAVTYSYLSTGGMVDSRAMQDVEADCQETYQRQTEQAYQVTQRADSEFVAGVAGTFDKCLQAEGLPTLGARSASTIDEALVSMAARPELRTGLNTCLRNHPSINDGLARK